MDLARLGNKYLADTEPWKLIKTDENRVNTILNVSLQIVAGLSIVSEPFLPFTSRKLQELISVNDLTWKDAGRADILPEGHQLNSPQFLFEKIEDEVIEKQIKKLMDTKTANEQANKPVSPAKEEVTFDQFSQMDIRLGTILEAEKVAKSKKLLKLKVDTGIDTRTVVSGIAEHFEPENILGKQVSILVNLAPRQIMGIESKGMILMAEDKDGKLKFLTTESKVDNGSTVS
jgi:methionyl-tRNA synthetase